MDLLIPLGIQRYIIKPFKPRFAQHSAHFYDDIAVENGLLTVYMAYLCLIFKLQFHFAQLEKGIVCTFLFFVLSPEDTQVSHLILDNKTSFTGEKVKSHLRKFAAS